MVQANTPTKAAARKSRATKASSRQATKASSAGSTRSMSAEHKQALAVGRQEGRTIRQYLEALQAHRPRRGRRRGAESIQRRLQQIDYDLPHADALSRIQLLQEQMDLQSETPVPYGYGRPGGVGGGIRQDSPHLLGAEGNLLQRLAPGRRAAFRAGPG